MRQALGPGALGRPRVIGQRGRREGGIGMGNTCKSMADSFQCMENPLQKKNAFNMSFKTRCAGIKIFFFFFFLSEKLFISLSVLKYNFTGHRFLDNDFFLSAFSLFHLTVFACLVSEKSDEIPMFGTL